MREGNILTKYGWQYGYHHWRYIRIKRRGSQANKWHLLPSWHAKALCSGGPSLGYCDYEVAESSLNLWGGSVCKACTDDFIQLIQAHLQEVQSLFAQLDRHPDPRQRLLGLLAAERESSLSLARYGCPYGSLSQELNKEDGQPAITATLLLQAYLDWAATQFRLLGKNEEEAKDFAIDLISPLQGTLLLTNSFRSPELLDRKLQRLEIWLRTL